MAIQSTFTDETRIALGTVASRASGLFYPNIRLGVTGLSRAGKSVFITALIHNLVNGGRLPLFEASAENRIARAFLEPQPDDDVPRFAYEDHVANLIDNRIWPDSTRSISQLRLTIEYESASTWSRLFAGNKLHVDIVDYPGEWLLDLPLLGKSFSQFSADAIEHTSGPKREKIAADYLALADKIDPDAPLDETAARQLSDAYKCYLQACRAEELALSTLPPGRFLMPGDLENTPALTFAPLKHVSERTKPNSMQAIMQRRYEAYKDIVVRPFFRDHITRLDRQIVLVDAMQAINAGGAALKDLEKALSEVLACFRPGAGNLLTSLWQRKIDRILVAATKADHVHHENHGQLEALVEKLVEPAKRTAGRSGASVKSIAMSAIRATREGTIDDGGEVLPVIIGVPMEGERIGKTRFDGKRETAVFPGDLPHDIETLFSVEDTDAQRFVKMRPPKLERDADGNTLSLPHIRMDKALQYLLGDRLA
ncbi:MAG: YcjX family protein [Pseudomonadota bacterium]